MAASGGEFGIAQRPLSLPRALRASLTSPRPNRPAMRSESIAALCGGRNSTALRREREAALVLLGGDSLKFLSMQCRRKLELMAKR